MKDFCIWEYHKKNVDILSQNKMIDFQITVFSTAAHIDRNVIFALLSK